MNIENTSVRLKQLMQERKLRQVDLLDMVRPFCEKYNVKMNKSDISQYLSGTVKPGQEKLSMLGMALNVNEAWLMGYDVQKEKPHYIETLSLSKDEVTMINNYKKLNSLGKEEANKRVSELTMIPTYTEIKNNVTELIPITKTDKKEIFIPYNSLDEAGTTIAAHDDDLTDEEKKIADKILLDHINNERLKEFNKKHNIK